VEGGRFRKGRWESGDGGREVVMKGDWEDDKCGRVEW
jgi:hypothetical protein